VFLKKKVFTYYVGLLMQHSLEVSLGCMLCVHSDPTLIKWREAYWILFCSILILLSRERTMVALYFGQICTCLRVVYFQVFWLFLLTAEYAACLKPLSRDNNLFKLSHLSATLPILLFLGLGPSLKIFLPPPLIVVIIL